MDLNAATLSLMFIGAPGVLCYFTLSKLIGRVGRGGVEAGILVFLYAVGAYVLYAYTARVADALGLENSAAQLILASPTDMSLRASDVAGASMAGFALAYLLAYGYRFNIVNRAGQRIGATNRAGDEDVWHFFHNASREPWSSEWIVVRDHKTDLQYFGAVSHWSESGEDRELLLTQVSVFGNSDGQKRYDCDHMYLCRAKDDLTIEIHAAGRGISHEQRPVQS
jgi:hypothetical protein